jgi:hypothetical protein
MRRSAFVTMAPALPDWQTMQRIGTYGVLLLLAGMMFISRCHHPVPSSAAVEMVSGVVAEADGAVAREVTAAFDRAETAVQHADLDSLMLFYEKGYNYHGLKRPVVQRVWTEVFSHYREINSTHLFTELKVVHAGSVTKAFVTCTGGLYGTDKESGKPVTIDSWIGEVHYLVKEGTAWKFLGNVGGAVREVPATSAPHHPLF